jgi:predicted RNase H-like nuclease (RuvC/YqgF family)
MANRMGSEETRAALEAVRIQIRQTEDMIEEKRKKREEVREEARRAQTREERDKKWEEIHQLEGEIDLLQNTLFEDDHEEDWLMEELQEAEDRIAGSGTAQYAEDNDDE